MKALATFLLALTPLLPVTAADSEPACDVANEAATEEAVLADVMTVYDALPDYSIFFWLEQDEEQRLNYLVLQFRSTLIELWTDVCLPPEPYPNPVLPLSWRTEARMRALQSFFEQLPNLRMLVLDRATWQDAEPTPET